MRRSFDIITTLFFSAGNGIIMHHRKLAHGNLKVSSIVNRGSVGDRIKKDENFLLHVLVHADSERIMYVALLGGNIEHL